MVYCNLIFKSIMLPTHALHLLIVVYTFCVFSTFPRDVLACESRLISPKGGETFVRNSSVEFSLTNEELCADITRIEMIKFGSNFTYGFDNPASGHSRNQFSIRLDVDTGTYNFRVVTSTGVTLRGAAPVHVTDKLASSAHQALSQCALSVDLRDGYLAVIANTDANTFLHVSIVTIEGRKIWDSILAPLSTQTVDLQANASGMLIVLGSSEVCGSAIKLWIVK